MTPLKMINKIFIAFFLFCFSSQIIGQNVKISGVVKDLISGESLPGVTVLEKNTYNGVFTDSNGNYSLTTSTTSPVLLFTSIGYIKQEITIESESPTDVKVINIELKLDVAGLEEAVVMGYGNQERSKISGAVATIGTKEITSLPVLRTEQALQGRTSGVQVSQNSGQPGSTQSIRIRGTGSLNNSEPLFVVDGIPSFGIDYLNASDIESITVLKDAASAAIYGARGGNGVILVTTKKGRKNQKPQIKYDTYYGMQEPSKYMSLLNAEEYAILMNESRSAAGYAPYSDLLSPEDLGEGTHWQKEIFERAPIMNHAFNFTSGTESSSTAVGGSYFVQDGIIGGEKSQFERYTFRISSTQDGSDRLRMGQNINFTNLSRNALGENNEFATPVVRALNMDPVTPATRPDGTFSYSNFIDSDIANPANQIANTFDNWITNRFVGSAFAEYDILHNLSYKSTFSTDLSLGSQKIFMPTFDLGIGSNDPNRPAYEWRETNVLIQAENKYTNWQWENLVSYDQELNNGNKLDIIAGYSALYNEYSNLVGVRDSLATNDPDQAFLNNSINSAEQAPQSSGGISQSAFLSTFIRTNYEIGNQWSFSGTVRRDGSSKFGENNRYGVFPSFSAAFNLTELPWVIEKDWIEFVKLRGSWGRNGNADGIGNFDYTSIIYNGLNYTFGTDQQIVNGAGPINTSNPDLKWETVEQTNVGVDIDLFQGKLNMVCDYFVKNTNDMLAVVPVPGVVGFNPSATNVASAKNSGIELEVSYKNYDNPIYYSLGGNISFIKNEVTGLGEGGQPISSGNVFGAGDFVSYTEIGLPIAYFYGYETGGIFQTNEEAEANTSLPNAQAGDVIFVDQNADGMIDGEDKVMIGNPHPDFTYAMNCEVKYKSFDLSVFLQGSQGNDIYNGIFRYDLNTTNLPISALERWTGEGSTNEYPRISHSDPNQNNRVSDRFVEDGSYFRIKNLQIGYTLNNTSSKKIGASSVRIYVSAQNLLTFTNYSGLDPEIGSRGTLEIAIDRGFYPSPRIFMGGVNVSF